MLIGLIPLAGYGQTIVSTDQENRKAILEEFTGIHCQYCPQGHAIAEQILEDNPGNAFAINIHQGGYATPGSGEPDFRTPFGNAIANQTGLVGYPAGTMNRQNFPGLEMGNPGTTALDRGYWKQAASEIISESSYVNVGVEAHVDYVTREMTINVEVYYTGDSPLNTNKLNVFLLQNNTTGPQTGGGQGSNYNHMRRLIDVMTGQWGEDITTTTEGSFIQKTYNYTIPADLNGIPIVLGELELVAFVAETNQEIVSGNGAFPSYTNLALDNDISIKSVADIAPQCSGMVSPVIEIKNNGNEVLTSLDITYSVNGGTEHTYTWTGNLGGLQFESVQLPEIPYDQNSNTIEISLPNDEVTDNNTGSVSFDEAINVVTSLTLSVHTDSWGEECTWEILNSSGEVVYAGGPYDGQNNQTFTYDLDLPGDCYTFNLHDVYGDGGGAISLKDANGVTVYSSSGNYGAGVSKNFSTGVLNVSDLNASEVRIYPNPSTGLVNISSKADNNIEVFDMTGRRIYTTQAQSGTSTLDMTPYGKGIFVVKISDGKNIITKKVIIK